MFITIRLKKYRLILISTMHTSAAGRTPDTVLNAPNAKLKAITNPKACEMAEKYTAITAATGSDPVSLQTVVTE